MLLGIGNAFLLERLEGRKMDKRAKNKMTIESPLFNMMIQYSDRCYSSFLHYVTHYNLKNKLKILLKKSRL